MTKKVTKQTEVFIYLFVHQFIYFESVYFIDIYFYGGGGGGTNKYILFDGLVCSIEEYFY